MSSSSSSFNVDTRLVRSLVINQNNGDLLPFSWMGESGRVGSVGDDSILSFTIEGRSSAYVQYDNLLKNDNSSINENLEESTDVYNPNDNDSDYRHNPVLNVDVICVDDSGLSDVRAHVDPNKYEFDELGKVFFIPKFTWR